MIGTAQIVRARARVEAQMVDTCVIEKRVRSDVPDEVTGELLVTATPVYSGRCKFTVETRQVRDVDTQGQDLAVSDATLSIPVDAAGSALVGKDHVATIVLAANDATTVTAVVQASHAQTFATARRLPVLITT